MVGSIPPYDYFDTGADTGGHLYQRIQVTTCIVNPVIQVVTCIDIDEFLVVCYQMIVVSTTAGTYKQIQEYNPPLL